MELMSLVDDAFWTATPLAGTNDAAWFVTFASGIAYNALTSRAYFARCVR